MSEKLTEKDRTLLPQKQTLPKAAGAASLKVLTKTLDASNWGIVANMAYVLVGLVTSPKDFVASFRHRPMASSFLLSVGESMKDFAAIREGRRVTFEKDSNIGSIKAAQEAKRLSDFIEANNKRGLKTWWTDGTRNAPGFAFNDEKRALAFDSGFLEAEFEMRTIAANISKKVSGTIRGLKNDNEWVNSKLDNMAGKADEGFGPVSNNIDSRAEEIVQAVKDGVIVEPDVLTGFDSEGKQHTIKLHVFKSTLLGNVIVPSRVVAVWEDSYRGLGDIRISPKRKDTPQEVSFQSENLRERNLATVRAVRVLSNQSPAFYDKNRRQFSTPSSPEVNTPTPQPARTFDR